MPTTKRYDTFARMLAADALGPDTIEGINEGHDVAGYDPVTPETVKRFAVVESGEHHACRGEMLVTFCDTREKAAEQVRALYNAEYLDWVPLYVWDLDESRALDWKLAVEIAP